MNAAGNGGAPQKRQDAQWLMVRDADGEVVGEHETEEEALRALAWYEGENRGAEKLVVQRGGE